MICFSWLGFPQYGARCVRAFVRSTNERVVVVASRPDVPVSGMEELAECEVHWVGLNDRISLKMLLGEVPRVLTVPGWRYPLFNKFRDEVHANGGKVIAGVDNNYQFNIKTIIKMLQFRMLYRNKYDGFWVPNTSGCELMRFYGVAKEKIFTGSYTADNTVFTNGEPLSKRRKRLLFVGQFIERKNILRLCEAFLRANKKVRAEWILEMCGCGHLRSAIPVNPSILVHDFVQPEQLSDIYRKARAFVLPSIEEHWGFVVHEAALSGCFLLISNRVGAMNDFMVEGVNGFSFSPFSTSQLMDAILRMMLMRDVDLICAQQKSLEMAGRISLQSFVDSVKKFSAPQGV